MKLSTGVAYRKYILNDCIKIIIYNTHLELILFLEDLSANLFEVLIGENPERIENYAKSNDISCDDIQAFVNQLFSLGVFQSDINNCDNGSDSNKTNDESQLSNFIDELYASGYVYAFHLDVTNKCNERCIHCYHPFDTYNYKNELNFKQITTAIDYAYDLGVFEITLSGGEIFARKDIFDILEYISNKHMLITLYTNATLIDKVAIEKLKKYNIRKVSISLYADISDIHDKITQVEGSFENTISAIHLLKDNNFIVELKTVILKENYTRINQMKKLASKYNANLILDFGLCGKLNGDCSVYDHRITNETLRSIFYSDPSYYCGNSSDYADITPNSEPCGAGKTSLYCSADGNIYPCVSFRNKLCDYTQLKTIAQNESLIKWKSVRIKDFSDCFKHEYCNFCKEQCAGNNLIENHNYLNSKTSHCERAKIIYEWFKQNEMR